MKLKVLIAVVVVVVVLGTLGVVKALQIGTLVKFGKSYKPPPETISSTVARTEKWQATINAVGSVTAAQGVNVTTELSGIVTELAFESGALVAKGDLLLRLDTTTEEAQLRSLEATAALTKLNVERNRALFAEKTISSEVLETTEAQYKQATADADAVRATIAKKTIRAPFAGRLGIRQVNLGEYIEAGKTIIVSLQALDTVYAEFSLPQQELSQLNPGLRVRLTADTYPGKQFDGILTSLNPDLDPTTRAIRLQATFDNKEHLLRPGMFVRTEVLMPGEEEVLIIPAPAILSAPYGDSVYVITASTNSGGGQVVNQQFIRTGRARGDYISVAAGLKPGDKVASSGLFKLRNGSSIVENNDLTPKTEQAPKPGNS